MVVFSSHSTTSINCTVYVHKAQKKYNNNIFTFLPHFLLVFAVVGREDDGVYSASAVAAAVVSAVAVYSAPFYIKYGNFRMKRKVIKRRNIFRFLIKMLVSMRIQLHIGENLEAKAHRVDTVLSFFSVVGIVTPPPPQPPSSVPPPLVRRGHTRFRERGWGSLYISLHECLCFYGNDPGYWIILFKNIYMSLEHTI